MRRWLLVAVSAVWVAVFSRPAVVVQADPADESRLHWVTNGTVIAGAVAGDTLYIGGSFTRVAPPSAALGSFFGFDRTTGAATSGLPLVDGVVEIMEPDGAGGYYISGRFTRVGGLARDGLARIRADGSVDRTFVPGTLSGYTGGSATVRSMARVSGALYISGEFGAVAGTTRGGVAALDAVSGGLLPWLPQREPWAPFLLDWNGQLVGVSGAVSILDPTTGAILRETPPLGAHGTVLVFGSRLLFQTGSHLGAVDLATGVPEPDWTAVVITQRDFTRTIAGGILAMAVSGSTLYIAGGFDMASGNPRTNLAAVDLTTKTITAWAPSVNGSVTALVATPAGVIAAGDFTTANGLARDKLAEFDSTGATTSWSTPVAPMKVLSVVDGGAGRILATGRMAINGGIPRTNLAAFDLAADDVLPWAPEATKPVEFLHHAGSRVFVTLSDRSSPSQPLPLILDDTTGASAGWADGPFDVHVVDERWLYSFDKRRSAETGAIDPGWHTIGFPMIVREGILYSSLATSTSQLLGMQDTSTGEFITRALWLLEGGPTALAIDGSTLFAELFNVFSGGSTGSIRASDLRSQLRVGGIRVESFGLVSVDGQLMLSGGRLMDSTFAFVPGRTALFGQGTGRSPVIVTPTDVVAMGVNSVSPVPINGMAVFARRPPVAPHGLTWVANGNQLTLTWTPPGIAPPSYMLEAGSQQGLSDLARIPLGRVTSFTGTAPNGTYYVRVRPQGVTGAAMTPTNEVAVVVGCVAPPEPPFNLIAAVRGPEVSLRWTPSRFARPLGYMLEAGSRPGLSDVARMPLGPDETSFSSPAPAGTYFARIRAINACGAGGPTPDVFVTVGAGVDLPVAPGQPTVTVTPTATRTGDVELRWLAVPNATSYVVEVGSAPMRTDRGRYPVTSTFLEAPSVVPTDYFVRVRAVGVAGLGPPSPDVKVGVNSFFSP